MTVICRVETIPQAEAPVGAALLGGGRDVLTEIIRTARLVRSVKVNSSNDGHLPR